MICNPGNALVRYEFMEFIARVAHDRYLRNKICETDTESLQKLLDEHSMKILEKYDSNRWRWDVYICEDIDLTLKAHKAILDALYKKFSGKKTLPGYKPFMSLEEF